MNNASMQTADRSTHLKVVVVSLIASMAVIVVGLSARTVPPDTAQLRASAPVLKAGKPVVVTHSDTTAIR